MKEISWVRPSLSLWRFEIKFQKLVYWITLRKGSSYSFLGEENNTFSLAFVLCWLWRSNVYGHCTKPKQLNVEGTMFFLYLTGTLPHVLHVCISHLGMHCWQWVIQLSRWIYSQEQDERLMGQSLEKVTKRKKQVRTHSFLPPSHIHPRPACH